MFLRKRYGFVFLTCLAYYTWMGPIICCNCFLKKLNFHMSYDVYWICSHCLNIWNIQLSIALEQCTSCQLFGIFLVLYGQSKCKDGFVTVSDDFLFKIIFLSRWQVMSLKWIMHNFIATHSLHLLPRTCISGVDHSTLMFLQIIKSFVLRIEEISERDKYLVKYTYFPLKSRHCKKSVTNII